MAYEFKVKNGLITPNLTSTGSVKIGSDITINPYTTDSGTLSFEGSAGQLFSITNDLSGTIFSVNDISGIPSIEILDTGLVKIAQYSGNVLVGTSTDNSTDKLQINGSIIGTVIKSTIATGTAPLTITSTTRVSNLNVDRAATADILTTARTLTIGSTGKTFNGSADVSWSLAELGAYSATNPSGYTTNTGTVTGVTGTAPVVSSGGTAPAISMAAATASVNGYMTSTYASKLDGIADGSSNALINATDDTTTSPLYPIMVGGVGSNQTVKASTTKLSFNASTGTLSATAFNSTSDIRLKDNILTIDNALTKVKALRGVTFTRNDLIDKDRRHIGVIAQEVLQIIPEAVDLIQPDDYYTVAYGNLVGLLIEAIKEQQANIIKLENRMLELESGNLKY